MRGEKTKGQTEITNELSKEQIKWKQRTKEGSKDIVIYKKKKKKASKTHFLRLCIEARVAIHACSFKNFISGDKLRYVQY